MKLHELLVSLTAGAYLYRREWDGPQAVWVDPTSDYRSLEWRNSSLWDDPYEDARFAPTIEDILGDDWEIEVPYEGPRIVSSFDVTADFVSELGEEPVFSGMESFASETEYVDYVLTCGGVVVISPQESVRKELSRRRIPYTVMYPRSGAFYADVDGYTLSEAAERIALWESLVEDEQAEERIEHA